MKDIEKIKERLEYDFKSLKDFDPVSYFGGEMWKPYRKFEKFKLSAKELGIPEKMFDDLKHFQEEAWMFCDTVILENHAENGYHYLDYALHGERLNWKKGDEYWLVVNCACKGRLELRKADPEKWTPLEKFYVDKNLNIKLKLCAIPSLYNMLFSKNKPHSSGKHIIKVLGINSFPDRIELMPHEEYGVEEIINYYNHYSSFNYKNIDLNTYFKELIYNEKIQKELKTVNYYRHYGLENENDKNEDPEIYKNIFIKHCHDLHYRQKHLDQFSEEYE